MVTSSDASRTARRVRRVWVAGGAAVLLGMSVVGEAPVAFAASVETVVTLVNDGTGDFEDWCNDGTDTGAGPCPAGDGEQEPGDDLGAHNGVVRVGDQAMFRVAYSVNPPLPSTGRVVLTGTVTGGAGVLEGFALSPTVCPDGFTVSGDAREAFTCDLGVQNASSTTGSFDLPVFAPASLGDGREIAVSVSIDDTGDGVSASTAVSPAVMTSAAPRVDLQKRAEPVSGYVDDGTEYPAGWDVPYVLAVRAGDADGRGNSSVGTITVGDILGEAPGAVLVSCQSTAGRAGIPAGNGGDAIDPATTVRDASPECAQPGGAGTPIQVVLHPDWGRTAAAPTHDTEGGTLDLAYRNTIAVVDLVVRVPLADVDTATAPVGDGAGQLTFSNSIGADRAGVCGEAGWVPDSLVSQWDPEDIGGHSNWGDGAEDLANNGACQRVPADPARFSYAQKNGLPGLGVTDQAIFSSSVALGIASGPGTRPAGVSACDKFENDKFYLVDPALPDIGLTGANPMAEPIGGVVIEYGIGPWGRSSPSGASDTAAEYDVQSSFDCMSNLGIPGDEDGWVRAEHVDFSNSGRALVDGQSINMVRLTTTQPLTNSSRTLSGTFRFRAYPGPAGTQMRNYASFYDENGDTIDRAYCAGEEEPEYENPVCTVPLPPGASAGENSAWWQLVEGAVSLDKHVRLSADEEEETPLFSPGDVVPWRLDVNGWAAEPDDGIYQTGPGVVPGVVVTDTLPTGVTYTPGTSTARYDPGSGEQKPYMLGEPTVSVSPGGQQILTWAPVEVDFGGHMQIDFDTLLSSAAAPGKYKNVGQVASPANPHPHDRFVRDVSSFTVLSNNQAVVAKTVQTPVVNSGDEISFRLDFANNTATHVESFDAIDILSYDGDPGGSTITGTPPVVVGMDTSSAGEIVWVSGVPGTELDQLDGRGDGRLDPGASKVEAVGAEQWPCTWEQVADSNPDTCVGLNPADVTALRFIGVDPDPVSSGGASSFLPAGGPVRSIVLTLDTDGAANGDTYENAWAARFSDIPLPVFAEAGSVPSITGPQITLRKTVVGNLIDNADGTYTAIYDLIVTNTGTSVATYDLTDRFAFGPGIHVQGTPTVSALSTGGSAPDPAFTGRVGEDTVVTNGTIAVGDVHVYRVTATVTVPTTLPADQTDCIADPHDGTGLLNHATLHYQGPALTDSACTPTPAVEITKTLTRPPIDNGDGSFTVSYTLAVDNDGALETTYALDDILHFGEGITVLTTSITSDEPANARWNGSDAPNIVEDHPIGADTTHIYEATITVRVPNDITPGEGDCQPGPDRNSTGFLNTTILTQNGQTQQAEACAMVPTLKFPPPTPTEDQNPDFLAVTGPSLTFAAGIGILLAAFGAMTSVRRRLRPGDENR